MAGMTPRRKPRRVSSAARCSSSADWKWSIGKEKTVEVKEGRRLIAVATAAAWVKWQESKPVEYRLREPGVRMPEREELGDNDRDEWEAGPDGEPRDPWQSTRFVHLIDPQTAEAFTFSTSSWGGRDCVINLADQIKRMRGKHPDAVPVVELGAAPMSTQYGRKSKPTLKVVGWRTTDRERGGAAGASAAATHGARRKWTTKFLSEPLTAAAMRPSFFRCHHVRPWPQPRRCARARRSRCEDISRRCRQASAVQAMAGDRHHRGRHHCRVVATARPMRCRRSPAALTDFW